MRNQAIASLAFTWLKQIAVGKQSSNWTSFDHLLIRENTMKSSINEYAKLALVAIVASLVTALVMRGASEPQAVHAAPANDILPAAFKKDASVSANEGSSSASSATGKIIQVSGSWVEMTDGQSTWWVDFHRPSLYFTVR